MKLKIPRIQSRSTSSTAVRSIPVSPGENITQHSITRSDKVARKCPTCFASYRPDQLDLACAHQQERLSPTSSNHQRQTSTSSESSTSSTQSRPRRGSLFTEHFTDTDLPVFDNESAIADGLLEVSAFVARQRRRRSAISVGSDPEVLAGTHNATDENYWHLNGERLNF